MLKNSEIASMDVLAKEKLKSYLIELIRCFRKKLESLSAEERIAASRTLEDFSSPCQVMVIWAKEPEFQIIVIAHLKELQDELIEIHRIENSNLLDYIEKEVFDSPFVKIIGREKIENFLASSLRNIKGLYDPLKPFKPFINGKHRIADKPYTVGWIVIGSLSNFNIDEIVDCSIKSIISIAKPAPSPPHLEEKVILEGWGAYLYPPIWIGEIPKPKSFREKITGRPFWTFSSERVITTEYKGYPLILTRDGYLAIGIKEKPKALELLNEIISTLLLLGIPIHVIREVDLGEAVFRERGESKAWNPISSRAWLHTLRLLEYPLIAVRETSIEEEKFRKAIKLSELFTADEKIKTLATLLLESYTYFMNTEYKQALVMGWVILEDFYIEDLWYSHISKIASDEDRLNKLRSWTIDDKLEGLNIAHVITTEEYAQLMEIKKARNKIVHEGKTPRKEMVEKCLQLVSNIAQRYLGNYLGTMLPKL